MKTTVTQTVTVYSTNDDILKIKHFRQFKFNKRNIYKNQKNLVEILTFEN